MQTMKKEELSKLLYDCLRKANLNIIPSEEQVAAIYSVAVERRDTLLVLPTGSGKSLPFQILPSLLQSMGIENAIILLICPLVSLMKAHKKELLEKFDIQAGILSEETDRDSILCGRMPVVMGTPESWVTSQTWREMLLSDVYQMNVFTVVADEVHCVPKWGTKQKDEARIFRASFGRLQELRSLVPEATNILALKATASKDTIEKVKRILCVKNVEQIVRAPYCENIKLVVQNVNTDMATVFETLISDIRQWQGETPRAIIYCSSIKECAQLFNVFERELGDSAYVTGMPHITENRYFAMYHHATVEKTKDTILTSLLSKNGTVRVVMATTALGMGVNIPNIRTVYHWGPSRDIEGYIQEIGRAGRDRAPATAILLYHSHHLGRAKGTVKEQMKISTCRRQFLQEHFPGLGEQKCLKHNCSDVCHKTCDCGDNGLCNVPLEGPVYTRVVEPVKPSMVSSVQSDQLQLLRDCLVELREELCAAAPVSFCGPDLTCGLSDGVIDIIVEHARYIFHAEYILLHLPVMSPALAQSILQAVYETFEDFEVAEEMLDLTSVIAEWSEIDLIFDGVFDDEDGETE